METERRSFVLGPAGTDSSTENAPPSRAGQSAGKWARAFRITTLTALGVFLVHSAPAAISLSHAEALRVGRQIWQNECGGTVAGLTSWNAGEDFASLGIGHFIWYPAGDDGPFEESFPDLIAYARKRGAKLPDLLLQTGDCPWRTRGEFRAAENGKGMSQLRRFLADTIDLQADFLVQRLQGALPKMLAAAPASERGKIEHNFQRVARSATGCYALIDYVNFKGEGVLATERYRGRGWGLSQVLAGMSEQGEATRAFADSAGAVLRERVRNAPPERKETRWLPGWLNRVATYR